MMGSKKVGVVMTDFCLVHIDVEPIEKKELQTRGKSSGSLRSLFR